MGLKPTLHFVSPGLRRIITLHKFNHHASTSSEEAFVQPARTMTTGAANRFSRNQYKYNTEICSH